MIPPSLAGAMIIALVARDKTTMRAAPDLTAPQQAVLWKGDWLEVRGQRKDFLQVWDHRRERPGYVHLSLVKRYALDKSAAPTLRALVDYLQHTAGAESLGIGYAALYLKVAPPAELDGWIFTAIGRMAHRLARRASARSTSRRSGNISAHMDVAASYGVRFVSFEDQQRTRVCYDGEAFRRALALKIGPEEQADAILGLTDPTCVRPDLSPPKQRELRAWQLSLLTRADPARMQPVTANRLRLRTSMIAATLAFDRARRGKPEEAARLGKQALASFLRVDKNNLAQRDTSAFHRAAILASAARWTREPAHSGRKKARKKSRRGPHLELTARDQGETCVTLIPARGSRRASQKGKVAAGKATAGKAAATKANPAKDQGQTTGDKPLKRCTYGLVWESSIRRSRRGGQLAMAVQHMAGWQELWIFHKLEGKWTVTPLVPAITEPQYGYVELAGWTPGDRELLVVREAMVQGRHRRRFQAIRTKDLAIRLNARSLDLFSTFRRWRSAEWKANTLALR